MQSTLIERELSWVNGPANWGCPLSGGKRTSAKLHPLVQFLSWSGFIAPGINPTGLTLVAMIAPLTIKAAAK